MASDLRSTIQELARRFATDVLGAVAAALEENVFSRSAPTIVRLAPGRRPRGRRRIDVTAQADRALAVLGRHRDGVRAEDLRQELVIDKGTFRRVLDRLVDERRVRKTGERRRTTYFATATATEAKAAGGGEVARAAANGEVRSQAASAKAAAGSKRGRSAKGARSRKAAKAGSPKKGPARAAPDADAKPVT